MPDRDSNRPTRVASLVRVSTTHIEQADSPKHQLEFIQHETKRQGWVDTGLVYEAELTGAVILDRPDIQRMLRSAAEGLFDAIVLKSVSRLGRDTLGLLMVKRMLDDLRVELIAVADGYRSFRDPELIFLVHAERAQAGRQEISKNVKAGIVQAARRGIWPGGTLPFGFRKQGRFSVVADPQTAPLAQLIFALRNQQWSLVRICTHLNQELKVKAPEWWHRQEQLARLTDTEGAAEDERIQKRIQRLKERLLTERFIWHPRTIRIMCRNTAYCGELLYNRSTGQRRMHGKLVREGRDPADWVTIPCQALVARKDWDAVQAAADTQRRLPRKSLGSRFLLSGLVVCGRCGSSMRGQPARANTGGRGGERKGYYLCRGAAESGLHPGEYVRASALEAAVLNRLRQEVRGLQVPDHKPGRTVARPDPAKEMAALEANLEDLGQGRFFRLEALRKGQISEEEFNAELAIIRKKEEELQRRLDAVRQGRLHAVEEGLGRQARQEAAEKLLRLEGPEEAIKALLPTLVRKVVVHLASSVEVLTTFTKDELRQSTAAD